MFLHRNKKSLEPFDKKKKRFFYNSPTCSERVFDIASPKPPNHQQGWLLYITSPNNAPLLGESPKK